MQYLPIIATEMILASAVAIVFYWWDKRNAKKNQNASPLSSDSPSTASSGQRKPPTGYRRVPERTLLFVSLIGGWPGAWWASQRFRHKTKKRSFRIQFWIAVALNVAAIGWIVTR
jgi:uncharacterized membrane protein YsdA (DUF1294 family)